MAVGRPKSRLATLPSAVFVPFLIYAIAALGLKIRNGCSYHGLSLNVDMDLTPFTWINPCGYSGLQTIQLKDFGVTEGPDEVATRLLGHLQRHFPDVPPT